MKKRIAVIGSGISGMACAYYLRHSFDVRLYEKDNYIGGHTNTRFVSEDQKRLPIDTGFMVYNEFTYPNLVRLFHELKVQSYPTSMSFGVRNDDTGLAYCSKGASGFFAQKFRALDPRHWLLLMDIKSFFATAIETADTNASPEFTLEDFANNNKVSKRVMRDFVIPMAGAIWSTPPSGILKFPAVPLLRFLKNHGMLGIGTQYQWRTVEGGSESYKRSLLEKLPNPPETELGATSIHQKHDAVTIHFQDGSAEDFDFAIVATHADDALSLLANPTHDQNDLLSKFKYNQNEAILHSDKSVMPKEKAAWASWNVAHRRVHQSQQFSTHYWMNSLQRLDTQENYFVSIDSYQEPKPELVHWRKQYSHPRFDTGAIEAQRRLGTLNQAGPVRFCGSYFRNGFHEDALWSSINLVEGLLKNAETQYELTSL